MRVSRPKLIIVVLSIKFVVKSGELEFVKVTNDVKNFYLQKRLKNSIEKATLISLGIFRLRAKTSAGWQRLKAWNSIPMSFCPRELSFIYTF